MGGERFTIRLVENGVEITPGDVKSALGGTGLEPSLWKATKVLAPRESMSSEITENLLLDLGNRSRRGCLDFKSLNDFEQVIDAFMLLKAVPCPYRR